MAQVDTIDPALWGKAFWDTLHYAAAGYPTDPTDDRKDVATRFFSSFADVLPCNECRDHATAYVKAKPPTVASKDSLLQWTLDFHNAVNVKLGMPQMSLAAIRVKYLPRPVTPKAQAVVNPRAVTPKAPITAPKASATPRTTAAKRAAQPATRAMGLNSQNTRSSRGPIVSARNGTNNAVRDPVIRPRGPRPARKKCGCSGG